MLCFCCWSPRSSTLIARSSIKHLFISSLPVYLSPFSVFIYSIIVLQAQVSLKARTTKSKRSFVKLTNELRTEPWIVETRFHMCKKQQHWVWRTLKSSPANELLFLNYFCHQFFLFNLYFAHVLAGQLPFYKMFIKRLWFKKLLPYFLVQQKRSDSIITTFAKFW